ncbi:hypothetical protein MP228_001661 [Amoeboaphelidium protococcarum]|nr:hypothetical protein MP228_001661 [Amoeboaphelidium protococcarum]
MTSRQTVSIVNVEGKKENLPAVFSAPVRPDLIHIVHTGVSKNARQAYAVSEKAGHQTSAESWGTGRAVARIPRVGGGGTGRSGQGAFGNMCRGGRRFAPTKVWRKWHRHVAVGQRRFAVASAIAASAVASLVLARGHRVEKVAEVPLVVDESVESFTKTKQAVELLKKINAYADVEKVIDSRTLRAGKGKMRNRRFVQRRGPLVVYANDNGLVKAFRNIAGVELCKVDDLSVLNLAPGSHCGRFVIWTAPALRKLDALFGTFTEESKLKKNFSLPKNLVSNPDIDRVINSDEIQSVLRPANSVKSKRGHMGVVQKKNPLKNLQVMLRLNPYAKAVKRAEALKQEGKLKRKEKVQQVRRNAAFEKILLAD